MEFKKTTELIQPQDSLEFHLFLQIVSPFEPNNNSCFSQINSYFVG